MSYHKQSGSFDSYIDPLLDLLNKLISFFHFMNHVSIVNIANVQSFGKTVKSY